MDEHLRFVLSNQNGETITSYSETEDVNLPRNLVVVLHDFEQFEPSVMQDVFYIFR